MADDLQPLLVTPDQAKAISALLKFSITGNGGIDVNGSPDRSSWAITLRRSGSVSRGVAGGGIDAKVLTKANNTGGVVAFKYTLMVGHWNEDTASATGGTFVDDNSGATFHAFSDAAFSVNSYVVVQARGADADGKANYTIIGPLGSGGQTITGLFTSNAAGRGKYFGKSFTDPVSDVSAITNLAEGDFGTLSSTEDCLILVPPELGVSNTGHDITNAINTAQFSLYFTGRLVRTNGDGKKVVHVERLWAGCAS